MAVSVDQIQISVGRPLTSTEQAQAALWIEDARTIISHGPDGRSTIDLTSVDQATLDLVVREAVADRIKNPDPATKVTIAVDDGSTSREYTAASGQIRIRPEWWAMLLPEEAGQNASIPLVGRPDHHHHSRLHHHDLRPPLSAPSSYDGYGHASW